MQQGSGAKWDNAQTCALSCQRTTCVHDGDDSNHTGSDLRTKALQAASGPRHCRRITAGGPTFSLAYVSAEGVVETWSMIAMSFATFWNDFLFASSIVV